MARSLPCDLCSYRPTATGRCGPCQAAYDLGIANAAATVRGRATELYDAWKALACPGTWPDFLADAIEGKIACPECGPVERCDEDGCCLTCGEDLFHDEDGNRTANARKLWGEEGDRA